MHNNKDQKTTSRVGFVSDNLDDKSSSAMQNKKETMIKFNAPKNESAIIKVIGVGGGGSNAVNHMHNLGIKDVDFIICNTDAQALMSSQVPVKIQLGTRKTEGRGAGSLPEVGRESALESIDEIEEALEKNTKMLFITAGMGGGTGTGAAPIIAAKAKELGILTVGIVTMPFAFEGRKRALQAKEGIKELRQHVDSLLIINNDKLRELYGNLELSKAFSEADSILTVAAKGIAEIITMTGYVNVDFEDVRTVMKDSGVAIMGAAAAEGEDRALNAVVQALESPLLNDNNIKGAKDMLLYITSGEKEVLMDEITAITEYIQKEAGDTVEVIWGNGHDNSLGEKINVTLIATGFDTSNGIDYVSNKSKENASKESMHANEKKVLTLESETEANTKPAEAGEKAQQDLEFKIKVVDNTHDKHAERKTPENVETGNSNSTPEENREVIQKTDDGMVYFKMKKPEAESQQENSSQKQDRTNQQAITETENRSNEDHSLSRDEIAENIDETDEKRNYAETLGASRQSFLKELSIKLKDPTAINQMEAEPAYKRSKLDLPEVPHSSESHVSRYTLSNENSDDKRPKLKDNNSFLHEKPD